MRKLKLKGASSFLSGCCSLCLECRVLLIMLQPLLGKMIFFPPRGLDKISKTIGKMFSFEDGYEMVRLGDLPTQWERQKKTAQLPLFYTGVHESQLLEVRADSANSWALRGPCWTLSWRPICFSGPLSTFSRDMQVVRGEVKAPSRPKV